MSTLNEYLGRIFPDVEWFKVEERIPTTMTPNQWLSVIEIGTEMDKRTNKEKDVIKLVRYAPRRDKIDKEKKIWLYASSYNIRSSEEWAQNAPIISEITQSYIGQGKFAPISTKENSKLREAVFILKSEKQELKEYIKDLQDTKEAELTIFEKRISNMVFRIKEYEKVLKEYYALVTNPKTRETKIKNFLYNHHAHWMFGLEYVDIDREVGFPPNARKKEYIFDFMLKRYDKFWDLVECKGPSENLFKQRTQHRFMPNKPLSEAIAQVFKYLYVVDKCSEEYILKPKAYIVIGNKSTDLPKERRIYSSYLSNTELITYHELYKRGYQLLKYIRSLNKEVK